MFLADPEHLRKIVIKDHLYLENPLERCDMARLAHIRTASEHIFQHRFAAILEALCGPAVPLAANG